MRLGRILLLTALWGCNTESRVTDLNIAAVRKYHQVWSSGNVEELDAITAPQFASHFIGGFEYRGLAGAKKCCAGNQESLSGLERRDRRHRRPRR